MRDLPPRIRDYLAELVALRFSERESVPAVPGALPEGEVRRLIGGGPFGWMVDARLDEIDGRLALEVLEDSRMAGPEHYRVWEDGTKEPLDNEHTGFSFAADATEAERDAAEQAMYAHNRRVQTLLRERGFLR